jgi:hypothetical protein
VVIDRLFDAFNAQDAEEVADVFGDDVVYVFHDRGEELVGADVAAFFQSYFGRETGERITDGFHAPDGRTYFLGKFTFSSGGWATLVFDVEMDGERLVSMGDRRQTVEEVIAADQIDDLYEAFNDQDVDRLTEEFEGMTYRSHSGVEFTGADAAEHWADAFGSVVTRTSGVFAIGDGAYVFVTEHRDPDSGHSTGYVVEIERSGGKNHQHDRTPTRDLTGAVCQGRLWVGLDSDGSGWWWVADVVIRSRVAIPRATSARTSPAMRAQTNGSG